MRQTVTSVFVDSAFGDASHPLGVKDDECHRAVTHSQQLRASDTDQPIAAKAEQSWQGSELDDDHAGSAVDRCANH